ncbi:hypothetical protein BRC90_05605 [Halobacteriales archaeon QS_4_69_34]|nr:MAG: hypothetical protein BRC90_05605 [Halobacteriales archaeon QS_4_69_34]
MWFEPRGWTPAVVRRGEPAEDGATSAGRESLVDPVCTGRRARLVGRPATTDRSMAGMPESRRVIPSGTAVRRSTRALDT